MMAIVSGLFCIVLGLLRLGFVTELLSKPIRYGYMNGIALTVLISQLPKVFGVSIEERGPLQDLCNLRDVDRYGANQLVQLRVGAVSLGLILMLKRFERLPSILIAVFVATLCVTMFELATVLA